MVGLKDEKYYIASSEVDLSLRKWSDTPYTRLEKIDQINRRLNWLEQKMNRMKFPNPEERDLINKQVTWIRKALERGDLIGIDLLVRNVELGIIALNQEKVKYP